MSNDRDICLHLGLLTITADIFLESINLRRLDFVVCPMMICTETAYYDWPESALAVQTVQILKSEKNRRDLVSGSKLAQ